MIVYQPRTLSGRALLGYYIRIGSQQYRANRDRVARYLQATRIVDRRESRTARRWMNSFGKIPKNEITTKPTPKPMVIVAIE